MCVTICGRFCPDEGAVAGYGNRIRAKSPAKWGVQIAGMIFQTRSRVCLKYYSRNLPQSVIRILQKAFSNTLEFRTYAIFHQKGGWKMATPFTVYKLIILYMLRNSSSPITNSEISEFILDHEYTNYFHLQQALSELEETELIEKRTISNTSYYYLTEDGKNTLTYFENDISQDIRTEVLQYLAARGASTKNQVKAQADYYINNQGEYVVHLQLLQKGASVIDLSLAAPSLSAAKAMCRQWPKKYEEIYAKIMEGLL